MALGCLGERQGLGDPHPQPAGSEVGDERAQLLRVGLDPDRVDAHAPLGRERGPREHADECAAVAHRPDQLGTQRHGVEHRVDAVGVCGPHGADQALGIGARRATPACAAASRA